MIGAKFIGRAVFARKKWYSHYITALLFEPKGIDHFVVGRDEHVCKKHRQVWEVVEVKGKTAICRSDGCEACDKYEDRLNRLARHWEEIKNKDTSRSNDLVGSKLETAFTMDQVRLELGETTERKVIENVLHDLVEKEFGEGADKLLQVIDWLDGLREEPPKIWRDDK